MMVICNWIVSNVIHPSLEIQLKKYPQILLYCKGPTYSSIINNFAVPSVQHFVISLYCLLANELSLKFT